MIVFEVAANERVVRAGAQDQTSLSLRLNGGDGFSTPELAISAFRVSDGRLEKHYRWKFGPLALGDEVTIRVLDEQSADPPTTVDTSKGDLTHDEKALLRHETAKVKRLNAALQKSMDEATRDPTAKYCAFCGRSQHEARQLITGPGAVYICDECVVASVKLLDES
jgi:hypothetical protein